MRTTKRLYDSENTLIATLVNDAWESSPERGGAFSEKDQKDFTAFLDGEIDDFGLGMPGAHIVIEVTP